jgi:hypothetical protein
MGSSRAARLTVLLFEAELTCTDSLARRASALNPIDALAMISALSQVSTLPAALLRAVAGIAAPRCVVGATDLAGLIGPLMPGRLVLMLLVAVRLFDVVALRIEQRIVILIAVTRLRP